MADHDVRFRAIAVVLAPSGSERASMRALSAERPWRVHAVSDPMLAMAEIALADRAAGTEASLGDHAGSDDDRSVSFILAHPQKWAMRHELLGAITRYFPRTRLFDFDERGLHESKVSRKARTKGKQVYRGERGKRGAEMEKAQPSSSPCAISAVKSVSREEIDMLLGGESR